MHVVFVHWDCECFVLLSIPSWCFAVPGISRDYISSNNSEIRLFSFEDLSNDVLRSEIFICTLTEVDVCELHKLESAFLIYF
jgi:hypothetical protein